MDDHAEEDEHIIGEDIGDVNAICEAINASIVFAEEDGHIGITTTRPNVRQSLTRARIKVTGLATIGNTTIAADPSNKVIYSISGETGDATIIAGKLGSEGDEDGHALEARFTEPTGLAIWRDGAILVTDDNCIRSISSFNDVTTLCSAGLFPAYCQLTSIAVCPDDSILVISTKRFFETNVIFKINIDEGTVTHIAGSHDHGVTEAIDGIGEDASFNHAHSICCSINPENAMDSIIVGSKNGFISRINTETNEVIHDRVNGNQTTVCVTRNGSLCIAQSPTIQFFLPENIEVFDPENIEESDHLSTIAMSGMLAQKRFKPSRVSSLSPWAREAIQAVLTMVSASKRVGPAPSGGLLKFYPVLPEEIWLIILGLIPHHMLGKPNVRIPGPWQPALAGELGRPLMLEAFDERIAAFEFQLAELKAARARELEPKAGRETEPKQPEKKKMTTTADMFGFDDIHGLKRRLD